MDRPVLSLKNYLSLWQCGLLCRKMHSWSSWRIFQQRCYRRIICLEFYITTVAWLIIWLCLISDWLLTYSYRFTGTFVTVATLCINWLFETMFDIFIHLHFNTWLLSSHGLDFPSRGLLKTAMVPRSWDWRHWGIHRSLCYLLFGLGRFDAHLYQLNWFITSTT